MHLIRPGRLILALILIGSSALAACSPDGPTTQRAGSPEITSTVLLDAADRTVLDQLITYPATGQAEITASIIEIPPGVSTGWHHHEVPLMAHVLEGTLTVTYDTETGEIEKTYGPGDTLLEAIGTHHTGRNDGDTMVRLIATYIGAVGSTNSISL